MPSLELQKDLLDILLSGDDKFSAKDLRDHSLTFLAAGSFLFLDDSVVSMLIKVIMAFVQN